MMFSSTRFQLIQFFFINISCKADGITNKKILPLYCSYFQSWDLKKNIFHSSISNSMDKNTRTMNSLKWLSFPDVKLIHSITCRWGLANRHSFTLFMHKNCPTIISKTKSLPVIKIKLTETIYMEQFLIQKRQRENIVANETTKVL